MTNALNHIISNLTLCPLHHHLFIHTCRSNIHVYEYLQQVSTSLPKPLFPSLHPSISTLLPPPPPPPPLQKFTAHHATPDTPQIRVHCLPYCLSHHIRLKPCALTKTYAYYQTPTTHHSPSRPQQISSHILQIPPKKSLISSS